MPYTSPQFWLKPTMYNCNGQMKNQTSSTQAKVGIGSVQTFKHRNVSSLFFLPTSDVDENQFLEKRRHTAKLLKIQASSRAKRAHFFFFFCEICPLKRNTVMNMKYSRKYRKQGHVTLVLFHFHFETFETNRCLSRNLINHNLNQILGE